MGKTGWLRRFAYTTPSSPGDDRLLVQLLLKDRVFHEHMSPIEQ